MATAEECRAALESLTGRIADMDASDREAHLIDRTLSCRVPDLGLTFITRLGPQGSDPIRVADNGTPSVEVARDPGAPRSITAESSDGDVTIGYN